MKQYNLMLKSYSQGQDVKVALDYTHAIATEKLS